MAINSRMKGKRGELELAHLLNQEGFETRRGQQYCGANGDADVVGLPGVHIECKRVENLNLLKAYEQACHDAAARKEIPAVFHRKNHSPWLVTVGLKDFLRIYREFLEGCEKNGENTE